MIEIYVDGVDINDMCEMVKLLEVIGFIINLFLMKWVGVINYLVFVKQVVVEFLLMLVFFEVFIQDLDQIKEEVMILFFLGFNVYVKVLILFLDG